MLQCENALRLHGHARCESAVRALRSREHVNGRASSALLLNRPGRVIRSDLQTGAYGHLPEADSNIHRYLHGEGQD